jgi:CheY-like chemotaxis protein
MRRSVPVAGEIEEGIEVPTRRILVIDDDPEFRELIHGLLEPFGVDVVALAEPPPDVDAISRIEPDALILDLAFQPDDLSGWQLLQRIRDDPLTRDLPVLVCTAAAEEVTGQEAWLGERQVATLVKPFTLRELEERLTSLLGEPIEEQA